MIHVGRCHCGAIRYEPAGDPQVAALCHCTDCRRSAGAPFVAWASYPERALTISKGTPKTINSSGTALRSFCPDCGSGLFYRNDKIIPGIVDVQTATLDDPDALPSTVQYQTAERLAWVLRLSELPGHARFPG